MGLSDFPFIYRHLFSDSSYCFCLWCWLYFPGVAMVPGLCFTAKTSLKRQDPPGPSIATTISTATTSHQVNDCGCLWCFSRNVKHRCHDTTQYQSQPGVSTPELERQTRLFSQHFFHHKQICARLTVFSFVFFLFPCAAGRGQRCMTRALWRNQAVLILIQVSFLLQRGCCLQHKTPPRVTEPLPHQQGEMRTGRAVTSTCTSSLKVVNDH